MVMWKSMGKDVVTFQNVLQKNSQKNPNNRLARLLPTISVVLIAVVIVLNIIRLQYPAVIPYTSTAGFILGIFLVVLYLKSKKAEK